VLTGDGGTRRWPDADLRERAQAPVCSLCGKDFVAELYGDPPYRRPQIEAKLYRRGVVVTWCPDCVRACGWSRISSLLACITRQLDAADSKAALEPGR